MRRTSRMTHHLHPTAAVGGDHARHAAWCTGYGEAGAVTAVQTEGAVAGGSERPGPSPRRVRPPRWLDLRLVLGVLLVLGSVLIGARVVTAADATVPVWAASADLAAGTVLTGNDLVAVQVRLDDAAGGYLSTGTHPQGRTLARPVRRGELVPRSALDRPPALVQLALPVQAGYVPPGLDRGRLIDVYALVGNATGAQTAARTPGTAPVAEPVLAAVPVQAVSGRSEGVLSTPTTTVQVVVSLAADRVQGVLTAIGGRPLAVAVHDAVEDGDGAGAGAATGPTG
jgi:SAF domain